MGETFGAVTYIKVRNFSAISVFPTCVLTIMYVLVFLIMLAGKSLK